MSQEIPIKLRYIEGIDSQTVERLRVQKDILNYDKLVSLIREKLNITDLWNVIIHYNDDGDKYSITDNSSLNSALVLLNDKRSTTFELRVKTEMNTTVFFKGITDFFNDILTAFIEILWFFYKPYMWKSFYIFISLCSILTIPVSTALCVAEKNCDGGVVGWHSIIIMNTYWLIAMIIFTQIPLFKYERRRFHPLGDTMNHK
jgi:hypothetical protein